MFENNLFHTFPTVLRRDMGLWLFTRDGSSFLYSGETFASFQIAGQIHLDIE